MLSDKHTHLKYWQMSASRKKKPNEEWRKQPIEHMPPQHIQQIPVLGRPRTNCCGTRHGTTLTAANQHPFQFISQHTVTHPWKDERAYHGWRLVALHTPLALILLELGGLSSCWTSYVVPERQFLYRVVSMFRYIGNLQSNKKNGTAQQNRKHIIRFIINEHKYRNRRWVGKTKTKCMRGYICRPESKSIANIRRFRF